MKRSLCLLVTRLQQLRQFLEPFIQGLIFFFLLLLGPSSFQPSWSYGASSYRQDQSENIPVTCRVRHPKGRMGWIRRDHLHLSSFQCPWHPNFLHHPNPTWRGSWTCALLCYSLFLSFCCDHFSLLDQNRASIIWSSMVYSPIQRSTHTNWPSCTKPSVTTLETLCRFLLGFFSSVVNLLVNGVMLCWTLGAWCDFKRIDISKCMIDFQFILVSCIQHSINVHTVYIRQQQKRSSTLEKQQNVGATTFQPSSSSSSTDGSVKQKVSESATVIPVRACVVIEQILILRKQPSIAKKGLAVKVGSTSSIWACSSRQWRRQSLLWYWTRRFFPHSSNSFYFTVSLFHDTKIVIDATQFLLNSTQSFSDPWLIKKSEFERAWKLLLILVLLRASYLPLQQYSSFRFVGASFILSIRGFVAHYCAEMRWEMRLVASTVDYKMMRISS